MHASVKKYYESTLKNYKTQLNEAFKEGKSKEVLAVLHNQTNDLDLIIDCIDNREISEFLLHGKSEYCRAINYAAISDYRYANFGLRLFFESFLASIYFSGNDFQFQNWKGERFDILWSKLSCKETGPLSKNYVTAYCEELVEESTVFHSLACKVYRECSEYVHANFKTHLNQEEISKYDWVELSAFFERSKTVFFVCKFIFCARYLKSLNQTAKETIEDIILEDLGHLSPIKHLLGAN